MDRRSKNCPHRWRSGFLAGEIALVHKYLPLADAIIGAVAKQFNGKIISDDLHFNMLDIRRVWYK